MVKRNVGFGELTRSLATLNYGFASQPAYHGLPISARRKFQTRNTQASWRRRADIPMAKTCWRCFSGNPRLASMGTSRKRETVENRNTSVLYYTISIILGTVALSYGSVPMYKMASPASYASSSPCANISVIDLSTNGLGRPTDQSSWPWRSWRGPSSSSPTCD